MFFIIVHGEFRSMTFIIHGPNPTSHLC